MLSMWRDPNFDRGPVFIWIHTLSFRPKEATGLSKAEGDARHREVEKSVLYRSLRSAFGFSRDDKIDLFPHCEINLPIHVFCA